MVSPLPPHPGSSHLHGTHQSPPTSAVPGSLAGLLSPPDSRRTSGDEKDVYKPVARQSLPSISEALGAEQSLPYAGPVPPPPSAPAPTSQHYAPTNASPSDSRKRPFEPDSYSAQGPPNPFSQPHSPYVGTSAHVPPPPPPPPPQTQLDSVPRPPYDAHPPYPSSQHNPRLPSLHPIKTTQSPPPSVARQPYSSYPPAPPPVYDPPAPQPAEPVHHQYGYSKAHYPSYPPPPPVSNGPPPAYPPQTSTYSAPPRYYPTSLRDNTEARLEEKKLNRASLAPYGESVKRHLDSFDLEASLNEVSSPLKIYTRMCC